MQINVKRNMGDRRNRFHLLSVEESDEPDDKTFVKINNTNEHIVVTLQTLFSCMLREKKKIMYVLYGYVILMRYKMFPNLYVLLADFGSCSCYCLK